MEYSENNWIFFSVVAFMNKYYTLITTTNYTNFANLA